MARGSLGGPRAVCWLPSPGRGWPGLWITLLCPAFTGVPTRLRRRRPGDTGWGFPRAGSGRGIRMPDRWRGRAEQGEGSALGALAPGMVTQVFGAGVAPGCASTCVLGSGSGCSGLAWQLGQRPAGVRVGQPGVGQTCMALRGMTSPPRAGEQTGLMRTYRGGATVIVGEAEFDVVVELRSKTDRGMVRTMGGSSPVTGLTSWGGTLETDDEGAAWEILNGGVVRIRLPDSSEGEFMVSGGTLGESLRITGSGNPPF